MTDKTTTKRNWFIYMGMMDTFEYFTGRHPDKPDDQRNIKEWTKRASHNRIRMRL